MNSLSPHESLAPMSEPTGPSIDRDEVARFDRLAATWWDEAGPMRVLHRFNPVRLTYIRDTVCRHFGRDPLAPNPSRG